MASNNSTVADPNSGGGISVIGNNGTNFCSIYQDCGNCTSQINCGWCSGTDGYCIPATGIGASYTNIKCSQSSNLLWQTCRVTLSQVWIYVGIALAVIVLLSLLAIWRWVLLRRRGKYGKGVNGDFHRMLDDISVVKREKKNTNADTPLARKLKTLG